MTGKIPRKSRDKSSYANYLKKAREFIRTMEDCIDKEYYDSASLNGIHAIISSIDALLIFHAGVVSASQNHEDAVRLLIEIIPGAETNKQAKHALSVIRQKMTVEYMDELATPNEAAEISKHVNRFFEWAESKLPA